MTATLRNWALTVAAGCAALGLLVGAKEFLSGEGLSAFEGPLAVSGMILIFWAAEVRSDRAKVKWLWITGGGLNLIVLAMLVALPAGELLPRLLLTVSAMCGLVAALWISRTS